MPNNLQNARFDKRGDKNTNQNQKHDNKSSSIDTQLLNELEGKKNKLFGLIKDDKGFCDGDKARYDVAVLLEDFARLLGCEYLTGGSNKAGITSNSIRNVYDSYIAIKRRFQTNEISLISNSQVSGDLKEKAFEEIRPELIFAKAKVNYLVQRKISELKNSDNDRATKRAYEAFKEFIYISTDKITSSYKQFEAFMDLFETLIGFLKKQ